MQGWELCKIVYFGCVIIWSHAMTACSHMLRYGCPVCHQDLTEMCVEGHTGLQKQGEMTFWQNNWGEVGVRLGEMKFKM